MHDVVDPTSPVPVRRRIGDLGSIEGCAVGLRPENGLTDRACLEEGPEVRRLDVPHLRFGFGVVARHLGKCQSQRQSGDQ